MLVDQMESAVLWAGTILPRPSIAAMHLELSRDQDMELGDLSGPRQEAGVIHIAGIGARLLSLLYLPEMPVSADSADPPWMQMAIICLLRAHSPSAGFRKGVKV